MPHEWLELAPEQFLFDVAILSDTNEKIYEIKQRWLQKVLEKVNKSGGEK